MKINITLYKWAGSWGPFHLPYECGECGASEDVIKYVIETEFGKEPITSNILPWLDNWWRLILKGGWHAPIITLNGRIVSQGVAIDPGLLAYHIRKELVKGYTVTGNVVFSKPGCQHCAHAKELLNEAGIPYEDRNIIEDPLAQHQLFHVMKKIFPITRPITVPQVWLHGKYFGEADDVATAHEEGELTKPTN